MPRPYGLPIGSGRGVKPLLHPVHETLAVNSRPCGPGGTRTPDPLVRSQVLYPTELRIREGFRAARNLFPERENQTRLVRHVNPLL